MPRHPEAKAAPRTPLREHGGVSQPTSARPSTILGQTSATALGTPSHVSASQHAAERLDQPRIEAACPRPSSSIASSRLRLRWYGRRDVIAEYASATATTRASRTPPRPRDDPDTPCRPSARGGGARRTRRCGVRRAPPPRALGRHGVSGSSRGRGDLPRGPCGSRRRRILRDHVAPAVPARAQPRGGDRGAAGERRQPPRSERGRGALPRAADADTWEGVRARQRSVRVATRQARRRLRTPACSRSGRREPPSPRVSRHLAVRRADRSRPSSCRGSWPARGRGTGSGPRAAPDPAARRAPARSARGRREPGLSGL